MSNKEPRAYSKQQFKSLDFNAKAYSIIDTEGEFVATLDCKCWGKNHYLLAYFSFEDGRKIVAGAWQWEHYLGLAEMPFGSKVLLRFEPASTGKIYLKQVVNILESDKTQLITKEM